MATTYLEPGDDLEFTAPTGGVTVNVPVLIGGWFVIPDVTVAAGVRFNGKTVGVHTLTKNTGEAWAEGQAAFWDATNLRVTTDATAGFPIGSVVVAQLSADTTGIVKLNEISLVGRQFSLRRRVPIASINAGFTLLPAAPGVAYRLQDCAAIAVGGAVTSNTTADFKGTQSSSVVKLVAFTQASLTQSALVRAGSAGGTLLADGASFAKCDANTALTVGNTGSAITVATNIDFLFTVSLE